MTSADLEHAFAARAVTYAGGLLLLTPEDALELVRRAEAERIPVLGIDGFFVSPTETRSPIEHIADFSRGAPSGHSHWRDAASFIWERQSLGMYFEVTLGASAV
jgi:hypothetical protein